MPDSISQNALYLEKTTSPSMNDTQVFPSACTNFCLFGFLVCFSVSFFKWIYGLERLKYHLQWNKNQAVFRFLPFNPKCQNTGGHCLQNFEREKDRKTKTKTYDP